MLLIRGGPRVWCLGRTPAGRQLSGKIQLRASLPFGNVEDTPVVRFTPLPPPAIISSHPSSSFELLTGSSAAFDHTTAECHQNHYQDIDFYAQNSRDAKMVATPVFLLPGLLLRRLEEHVTDVIVRHFTLQHSLRCILSVTVVAIYKGDVEVGIPIQVVEEQPGLGEEKGEGAVIVMVTGEMIPRFSVPHRLMVIIYVSFYDTKVVIVW
jgi:hypothetical protein